MSVEKKTVVCRDGMSIILEDKQWAAIQIVEVLREKASMYNNSCPMYRETTFKIQAIKIVRAMLDCSLKEAKLLIEEAMEQ